MKKANTTVIGAFILGACALFVAGVLVFGRLNFVHPHPVGVAYFPDNVGGLNTGTPVNFRGVQIGTVKEINVEVDPRSFDARIPVYIEFEPERLTFIGGTFPFPLGSDQGIREAIKRGLTAQLVSKSLVTGQLEVDLDFQPSGNESQRLADASARRPIIPAVPSEISELKAALAKLPLDALVGSLMRVAQDADRLLSSPQLPELLNSFVSASENANEFLNALESKVDPMTQSVTQAADAARTTLQTAQQTLASTDDVMRTNVRATLRAAETAVQKATVTLNGADSLLAAGSQQRADIDQTLNNLASASQSLRLLTAELERRPNAILLGR